MGKYRRIGTDANAFINRTDIKRLTDPTALADWEYNFGGFLPNSNNPVRLADTAQTPTYIVPTEVPVYDDEGVPTGETEVQDIVHHYAWTDCKIVAGEVVAMTDEDKALRDAEAAAKADAKLKAAQADQTQEAKNFEAETKQLMQGMGITFPVVHGTLDAIMASLLAQISQYLTEGNQDDAIELNAHAQAAKARWDVVGDRIYNPYFGDGGVVA